MAAATLDQNTALIVIDLQASIAERALSPLEAAEVIERSAKLAAAFRAAAKPVVLVNVTGGAPGRTDAAAASGARPAPTPEGVRLVPELAVAPNDILITKKTWGAFTGTDLDARLRDAGVTQVVVTGIATTFGVESTARFAHELGYNVTLASDAMTDLSAESHQRAITMVFPALGEVRTTEEILAALAA
jgi:nicotinamidase-related amidase